MTQKKQEPKQEQDNSWLIYSALLLGGAALANSFANKSDKNKADKDVVDKQISDLRTEFTPSYQGLKRYNAVRPLLLTNTSDSLNSNSLIMWSSTNIDKLDSNKSGTEQYANALRENGSLIVKKGALTGFTSDENSLTLGDIFYGNDGGTTTSAGKVIIWSVTNKSGNVFGNDTQTVKITYSSDGWRKLEFFSNAAATTTATKTDGTNVAPLYYYVKSNYAQKFNSYPNDLRATPQALIF